MPLDLFRSVDERYDIRGYVLTEMVKACLQNRATLPAVHRPFFAVHAPVEAMNFLEERNRCGLSIAMISHIMPHALRFAAHLNPMQARHPVSLLG